MIVDMQYMDTHPDYGLGKVFAAVDPDRAFYYFTRLRETVVPNIRRLLETFRAPRLHPEYRPNGGFLTAEQWTAALHAAGFVDVRVLPDITRIREVIPDFYVAAIGATSPA